MLLKFFNKKITLDCFTHCSYVYESFKLKKEAYPKWANDDLLKNESFNILYKNSIAVPLWTDLTIQVDTFGNVKYDLLQNSSFKFVLNNYPPDKYHELTFSNVILLNLNCPWVLKEKEGIKFSFNGLLWNYIKEVDKFWFLNKILSFKDPKSLDIDFLITLKPSYQGIEAGKEIMQLIPMTEKEVDIKHHLVDEKEIIKLKNYGSSR